MIEQTLDRIATALEAIAARYNGQTPAANVPTHTVAPVTTPAPQTTPVPTSAQPAQQGTPAGFAPPQTGGALTNTAPPVQATFNSPQEMVAYVMEAYTALGAAKGAEIQAVLSGLGYANINDVIPDHYAALKAGIEALKVA